MPLTLFETFFIRSGSSNGTVVYFTLFLLLFSYGLGGIIFYKELICFHKLILDIFFRKERVFLRQSNPIRDLLKIALLILSEFKLIN